MKVITNEKQTMKYTTKTAIEIMTEEDRYEVIPFFESIVTNIKNLIDDRFDVGDTLYMQNFTEWVIVKNYFPSTMLKQDGYTILKGVPQNWREESENLKCPKCGCNDYEEWDELEYEKGGEDPMYGGQLAPFKYSRCGNCDNGESELDQLESEKNDLRELLKNIVGCTRQSGNGRNRLNDNKLGVFHIAIQKAKQLLEK